MSARITAAAVRLQVESVKAAAANVGAVTITYGGALFATLHLQQANGTAWLQADHPGGGSSDVGGARGLREVSTFLQGLHAGLDAIRYTRAGR